MNLKVRRLVRTPHSEQYALFDLDRTDANYDPLSIGKLDLHFAAEGVFGTFLLWEKAIANLPTHQIQALVKATVHEICEPMGVPDYYAIECFSPSLQSYALYSSESGEEGDAN